MASVLKSGRLSKKGMGYPADSKASKTGAKKCWEKQPLKGLYAPTHPPGLRRRKGHPLPRHLSGRTLRNERTSAPKTGLLTACYKSSGFPKRGGGEGEA